jgi:hypothetical protein
MKVTEELVSKVQTASGGVLTEAFAASSAEFATLVARLVQCESVQSDDLLAMAIAGKVISKQASTSEATAAAAIVLATMKRVAYKKKYESIQKICIMIMRTG